ncbi:MAG: hypothetical protein OEW04_10675 [Nitrospirota bacterium]|nr:hypothetical protein [Nitrospirota bacterium]
MKDIEDGFTQHESRLSKVKYLALDISSEMESLNSFIQRHTAVVCPECSSVCCINRHSYHTFDDIVYIHAIGEKIPLHKADIDHAAPCQFLGDLGCTIPRTIRPYRCNWYFCASLLDHITEHNSNRRYRLFISLLQQITGKRQKLMEEYASAIKSAVIPRLGKSDNFLYY